MVHLKNYLQALSGELLEVDSVTQSTASSESHSRRTLASDAELFLGEGKEAFASPQGTV